MNNDKFDNPYKDESYNRGNADNSLPIVNKPYREQANIEPDKEVSFTQQTNEQYQSHNVNAEPVEAPAANENVSADSDYTDLFDIPKDADTALNFNESSADSEPQQSNNASDSPAPYSCEWYGGSSVPTEPYKSPPYTPNYTNQEPVKNERKKRYVTRGGLIAGIAICLCLSFLASLCGTALFNYIDSMNTEIRNGLTINKVDTDDSNTAYSDGGLSTVEIVNKTADAVVEITTETVTTGVFAQQYIQSGAGSGVIVDTEGYIVTNHHVIDGATTISVTLRDSTSYDAELVGSDSELDVALLKIEPKGTLTAAVFGDSDNLQVGERTVAIGNPLGQLGGSVTEGILSALNRDVVIDGQTMSLLQTDTAINPGNSGGGLFDSNGNLVGIVNAKSSGTEVEGLGFAIPINDVVNVIGDLAEFGYVRGRVDLGMTFIDVDSQQLAWMYGLSELGCYIYSVDSGTNADAAGLNSGDRVISINNQKVSASEDVEEIIENCAVGEEITFTIETTTGREKNISFILEEYTPDNENENFFQNNNSYSDYSSWWSGYN